MGILLKKSISVNYLIRKALSVFIIVYMPLEKIDTTEIDREGQIYTLGEELQQHDTALIPTSRLINEENAQEIATRIGADSYEVIHDEREHIKDRKLTWIRFRKEKP